MPAATASRRPRPTVKDDHPRRPTRFVTLGLLGLFVVVGCAEEHQRTETCDDDSDCDSGWICREICLPDDQAGPESKHSEPTESQSIADLTDSEVDEVCEPVVVDWNSISENLLVDYLCSVDSYLAGLEAHEDGNDARQSCLNTDQQCRQQSAPDFETCVVGTLDASQRSQCEASVEAYLACEEESLQGYRDFRPFECDDIQPDGALEPPLMDAVFRARWLGDRCEDFVARCPPLD